MISPCSSDSCRKAIPSHPRFMSCDRPSSSLADRHLSLNKMFKVRFSFSLLLLIGLILGLSDAVECISWQRGNKWAGKSQINTEELQSRGSEGLWQQPRASTGMRLTPEGFGELLRKKPDKKK